MLSGEIYKSDGYQKEEKKHFYTRWFNPHLFQKIFCIMYFCFKPLLTQNQRILNKTLLTQYVQVSFYRVSEINELFEKEKFCNEANYEC